MQSPFDLFVTYRFTTRFDQASTIVQRQTLN